MKLLRPLILAAVLILAAAAVGVWGYRNLPPGAIIATHFNIAGAPNGFMSKTAGLAVAPILGAVVIAILAALPLASSSMRAGLERSRGAYGVILIGIAAIFLVMQASLVMRALNPDFDVLRWIVEAVGIFFVVIGALLGRIAPNPLIGIRTPWTLRDEGVWYRTHRFAGRLFVLAGVGMAAVAYFLGGDHTDLVAALALGVVVPAVVSVVYSRAISPREA